jgi:tripartite ATP-independent transporter DctP family solute receptor
MKKNNILLVVMLCLLVGLNLNVTVLAAKKVTLTIGHGSAVSSVEDLAVQELARVAKIKSRGKLDVQVFPAEQLGNFVSMMESVIMGSQDMVWGDLTWLGNVEKDYQILSMGYAFRSQEHLNKFLDSATGQDMKKRLEKKGILLVREHANQLPRVMVSKKPIRSLDDIQGLKMRVPGIPIFVKLWDKLGAKCTSVSWGEVYLALNQGVVDAMECGYEFIYPGKFYEVAKYVTLTNHVRGVRGLLMNPAKYKALPADQQKVIYEAAIAAEKLYNKKVMEAEVEHTKLLKAKGTVINDINEQPFKLKIMPLVNQLEGEGFWTKGLYEKVQAIK